MSTMSSLVRGTPVSITGIQHSIFLFQTVAGFGEAVICTSLSTGGGNVRCPATGRVDDRGGQGKWTRWVPHAMDDGGFSFENLGHRQEGRKVYLGVRNGQLVAVDQPESLTIIRAEPATPSLPAAPARLLTDEMRKSFIQTGFLQIPGLVDQSLVDDALRSINMMLGEGPSAWSSDPETNSKVQGGDSPAVLALLYNSTLFGVVEELLGQGRATRPRRGQLALRFPNNRVEPKRDDQWHIDGMTKHHMSPFNLLVGVALSAHTSADCGNLAVWPGHHGVTHDAVAIARRTRGHCEVQDSEDDQADAMWAGHRPKLDCGEAVQIKCQPGDVILAHQKLPHRISRNQSPHIRYMVYFRMANIHYLPDQPLEGLWAGFEGVQDLLS